jgi:adenosylcobinamide-GDP ribazoletransferase
MVNDLRAAFGLLTRLPAGSGAIPPNLARCVWAFPVVGLVVNGLAAAVYWGATGIGMPPLLAAGWALTVMMLLTGGLHEDGLADTADGFGGGRTPARKLEIMRDSRIGSYGALALTMSLLIRASAIAAIAHPIALVPAGMLGRAAMILPLRLLAPARDEGLGAAVRRPSIANAAAGLALAGVATLVVLPLRPAATAIIIATVAALILTRLARSQVGGHTGDVLGATELVTECAVFTVIACGMA